MAQNYEELQLGFDRTQLYKEFVQPQINRAAALRAVLDFCQMNELRLSTKETMRLVMRYQQFIETGDRGWAEAVDNYISQNKNK